jgi:pilus assembly protein CpaC
MKLHRAMVVAMRALSRTFPRALAGAMACACLAAAAPASKAQELATEPTPVTTVETSLDMAVGLRANGPVGKVVVSQPETAQVATAADDSLYLIGSQPGVTNLLVYDRAGRLSQRVDVQVGYDAQALRDLLADALPGEPITVKGLSSSLLLEGEVSSPSVAGIAEALAEKIAPDAVISRLHARSSQVLLDVRIMEVSSRGLKDISTAILITNGPELTVAVGQAAPSGPNAPFGILRGQVHTGRLRLDATLRALEEKGQLRIVAQPSLVALSGETASFRAGGEFPFPVPAGDGKLTIEFRPYGAAMKFQPVVQENGLIRIALEAELSDIDPSVAVTFDKITVPGLKVRRAATTTELRDGEAFMVAGLLEDSSERNAREPPFIAKIPLIGPVLGPVVRAFRGKESHRELAIVVTPRIGGQVASPLGERSLLAQADPGSATPEPTRTPKAVSAPRGPPLRALLAEVRDALRPPVRWVKQAASRFSSAVRGRA